jgi:hypothetical protein
MRARRTRAISQSRGPQCAGLRRNQRGFVPSGLGSKNSRDQRRSRQRTSGARRILLPFVGLPFTSERQWRECDTQLDAPSVTSRPGSVRSWAYSARMDRSGPTALPAAHAFLCDGGQIMPDPATVDNFDTPGRRTPYGAPRRADAVVPCLYCRADIPVNTFSYWSEARRLLSASCPTCWRRVTLSGPTWRRWARMAVAMSTPPEPAP